MKPRKPLRRRAPPEKQKARAKRSTIRAELDASLRMLRGDTPQRCDTHVSGVSADVVHRAALPTLEAMGITLETGGTVVHNGERVGRVERSSSGALRVAIGPLHPRLQRITSPTWLQLVRSLPCAICGRGVPFLVALRSGRAQSEANHYPGRGRSGGGSDLETHPACSPCHMEITDHRISDERQAQAVAETYTRIMESIRLGQLERATLLAVAVEAVLNA